MHRSLPVLLVLTLLVAGCAQDPKVPPAATDVTVAGPAQFSDTTGAIEGLVHDLEFQGLAGAEVGIPALGLTARTDDQGRYVFNNLDVGTVEVFAQKIGYDSAARRVEVRAGEVVGLDLALTAMASVEPYSETLTKKGLLGCAVQVDPVVGFSACGVAGLVGELTGQDMSGIDQFRLEWEVNTSPALWHSTVHEMQWRSSQALGSGLAVNWEVNLCSGDPKNTFGYAEGKTPLRVEADYEKIQSIPPSAKTCSQQGLVETDQSGECNEQMCRLQSRVFQAADTTGQAADVGVAAMQAFEQYFTVFFHAPAPEGFTALPDA